MKRTKDNKFLILYQKVTGFINKTFGDLPINSGLSASFMKFRVEGQKKSINFNVISRLQGKFSSISLLILSAFAVLSCEEEIQLDLEVAEPQKVIEANFTAENDSAFVRITTSSNYFEAVEYQAISDATVSITVNNDVFLFREIDKGMYYSGLPEIPDTDYHLNITTGTEDYTAISRLKPQLVLDSLSYEERNTPLEGKVYTVSAHFQDHENTSDFARLKLYINNEEHDEIYVYNDDLSNGNYIQYFFVRAFISEGDSVRAELYTIDKPVYDYFNTLGEIVGNQGGFQTTVPDNPISNITGGALGYFSIHYKSEQSIIIK